MHTDFSSWVACFCGETVAIKVTWSDEDKEFDATAAGTADLAVPTEAPDFDAPRIVVGCLCPSCENLAVARFGWREEWWVPERIEAFELIGKLDKLMLAQSDDDAYQPLVAEVEKAVAAHPDEPFLWEWRDFLAATSRPELDDETRIEIQLECIEHLIRLNPRDEFGLAHRADYDGQGGLWPCKANLLSAADRYDEAVVAMERAIELHPDDSFLKSERDALISWPPATNRARSASARRRGSEQSSGELPRGREPTRAPSLRPDSRV